MSGKPKITFDFTGPASLLLDQLRSVVSDVTDPKFQEVVQSLASDAADIGVLKARGADPLLIADAEESWKAGVQSAAAIPGLIAAEKVPSFISIVSNVGATIIATAFSVLRAYAGLPPAPPAAGG